MPKKLKSYFKFCGQDIPFFPSIGLKLTGACKFACPFCCEPDRMQTVANIETFFEIIDKLHEFGTKRLCFTGGDPLLYQHIAKLLHYTKDLGFYNLLLTTNGALVKAKYLEILPFLDAIRFSIHGLNAEHDKIVKKEGAFKEIEQAISILNKQGFSCYVTTVLTSINIKCVSQIVEWCIGKKVLKYFIFGIMKSGLGDSFIKTHGIVSNEDINTLMEELKSKYSGQGIEIIYYDYCNKAECILIYGDGRIVVDPYPPAPSFQLEIGNILKETPETILSRFLEDPDNLKGYCEHLEKYEKMASVKKNG